MKRSFEPAAWFEPVDSTVGEVFEPDQAFGSFIPDPGSETAVEVEPEVEAAAAAEAHRLREEALCDEARAEGRDQGYTTAIQELAPLALVLERAARRLDEERGSYLGAHRRAMVELAIAIAERLIGREVAVDPDLIVHRVQAAVELLSSDEPTLIHLNAQQYESLVETGAGPFAALLEMEHTRIEPRAEVGRDDFRVTSGASAIDGRLAPALARVRESLADLESADLQGEESQ